ncbi:phenylalanine ammonia-lyase class 3-like [Arachis duranensis]|uniref:Phenylalanine ammonia-lyase class 3-like n=1 Tax=Arachis duranensis TaxID=130453 RepID=A0A9C6T7W3_ARADU|nr:phenylalanine ammonia-lyase class 3-like [Arachis duranensis]
MCERLACLTVAGNSTRDLGGGVELECPLIKERLSLFTPAAIAAGVGCTQNVQILLGLLLMDIARILNCAIFGHESELSHTLPKSAMRAAMLVRVNTFLQGLLFPKIANEKCILECDWLELEKRIRERAERELLQATG